MAQANIYIPEDVDKKIKKLQELWGTNKHDTILRTIKEFEIKKGVE